MTFHRIGFQPAFLSMLSQTLIIVSQKLGSHNHDAHISGSFGISYFYKFSLVWYQGNGPSKN
jgi:hypothetical protein